ncbi:hypothetical protein N7478_008000 [Penicillium angulare]|uniref:uncharacterized protein n=1 Tax=Penicillium angulare TaxID=116970 RepID=UPI002541D367|nr:uncharacterized protein N7478_008000 [Penicillium angulare]KAJ5272875.1 hypothetical protein N7478_008000 [Penicillium angulare]
MPPIRAQSSRNSAEKEGRILLAIKDIKNGCISSVRAAATLYVIPHTMLADRVNGVQSRVDIHPNSHKLTKLEEDSLIE